MNDISRSEHLLCSFARWLLMLSVIMCVWLFGGSEPWAYILCFTLVFISACAWLFSIIVNPDMRLRVPQVTGLLLVVLLVLIIQNIQLPERAVRIISPFSSKASTAAVTAVEQGEPVGSMLDAVDGSAAGRITVSSVASMKAFCMYLGYLFAFLVTANCVRSWSHIKKMTNFIIVSGFILAIIGIIHEFSGSKRIMWFHIPRYGGNIFATFTNRNHYAFYANMIFGITLGRLLASVHVGPERGRSDWREYLGWMSTRRASRMFLLAFAAIFVGGSVIFCLSRGGMMAMMASLGITGIIYAWHGGSHKQKKTLFGVLGLIIAVVVWLGWRPVVERIGLLAEAARDPVSDTRFLATVDTLKIFMDNPLFGTGFGTFQYTFPAYSRAELHFGRWHHAHNDWAQILAEGGIFSGILMIAVTFFFIRYILQCMRMSVGYRPCYFLVGCFMAFVASLLHSMVDFGLHRPANALMFAVLCGLMVSASRLCLHVNDKKKSRSEKSEENASIAERKPSFTVQRICLCVALCMTVASMYKAHDCLRGELAFKRFEYSARLYNGFSDAQIKRSAILRAFGEARNCMHYNPGNVDVIRIIAEQTFNIAIDDKVDPDLRLSSARLALRSATEAVRMTPSDYLAWLWLAKCNALIGRWDNAEICMERAGELKPAGDMPKLSGM